MVLRDMPLLALNDQVQYRAYRANGGRAGFEEWITEKPLKPEASKLPADDMLILHSESSVQFGNDANQVYHTFRHTDALGLDRATVQAQIANHLKTVASLIIPGKPSNQIIEIDGHQIQYTAFKLPDGIINIGRIHEIP